MRWWLCVLAMGRVAGAEPLPTGLALDRVRTAMGDVSVRLLADMVLDRSRATATRAVAAIDWEQMQVELVFESRVTCDPDRGALLRDELAAHGGADARLAGTRVAHAAPNPAYAHGTLAYLGTIAGRDAHHLMIVSAYFDAGALRLADNWRLVVARIVATATTTGSAIDEKSEIRGITCYATAPDRVVFGDATGGACTLERDVGIGPNALPPGAKIVAGRLADSAANWIVWHAGGRALGDAGVDLEHGHTVHARCAARTDAALAVLRDQAAAAIP